jgi:hypothetical protein
MIKSPASSLLLAMTTLPFSLYFSSYSVVSFEIPALTSPKDLFPLNFGPSTGKFGRAYNLTYLST